MLALALLVLFLYLLVTGARRRWLALVFILLTTYVGALGVLIMLGGQVHRIAQ